METLRTEQVKLSDLRRFPGNARKHADAEIRASLRRLGQYRPLVVRVTGDGLKTILAGNGTADALVAEGFEDARCELLTCSDDEARRINVADNQISDKAKNDNDLLADLLRSMEGDYEGLGFSDQEVAVVLGEETMPDGGDADIDDEVGNRWGLVVECGSEDEQVRLLHQLSEQGLAVRTIMS
jgi:ParB-like chromosome segregation protein Spo0J